MTYASSMAEVVDLENRIMAALPNASAAGEAFAFHAPVNDAIRRAHDIICNGWTGPGSRLERLQEIAAALERFA